MDNSIEIAKALILESIEVGPQEMSIRRTSSGIAGDIATKVSNREKIMESEFETKEMPIEMQAEKLAGGLIPDEVEYAQKNCV